MRFLVAFLTGILFGLGLIIAGMANPTKVQAFLDLAGVWDPSLMLVMGGAIPVASIGYFLAKRRGKSILGDVLSIPAARHVDRGLLLGSLLFGTGWGLTGICPGPALLLPAFHLSQGLSFLLAMLAGMAIFELFSRFVLHKPTDQH
ncbi:DUF6691 family protein [Leeia oryzae]|uniref:DUF6691 family protein n=1 Tax=Leeia oryzae TaxID=356662 RepID=UPI000362D97E|nr:DUF6691 family protein [Leeia oryzae]